MRSFDKIIDLINSSNTIAIYSHVNTDMDAIGSSLALYEALQQLNKNVDVYSDSVIPDRFSFLPSIDCVNNPRFKKYDLSIALDSPNIDRIGCYFKQFYKAKETINIDHHKDNTSYAKINYVNPDESSTSFLIGKLIKELGLKYNNRIGSNILAGIITDTGGFKFSNTTKDTMVLVSEILKETDINISDIMHNIYECDSINQFKMHKIAVNNTKFYCDNKIAFIVLRKSDYDSVGADPEQISGFTQIGTDLKDVLITIVMSEKKENVYSVSFRGRGVDVQKCAAKFGGGGHKYASGCKLYGNFESAYEKLLKCAMDEV